MKGSRMCDLILLNERLSRVRKWRFQNTNTLLAENLIRCFRIHSITEPAFCQITF
jgi:hypothetical protein